MRRYSMYDTLGHLSLHQQYQQMMLVGDQAHAAAMHNVASVPSLRRASETILAPFSVSAAAVTTMQPATSLPHSVDEMLHHADLLCRRLQAVNGLDRTSMLPSLGSPMSNVAYVTDLSVPFMLPAEHASIAGSRLYLGGAVMSPTALHGSSSLLGSSIISSASTSSASSGVSSSEPSFATLHSMPLIEPASYQLYPLPQHTLVPQSAYNVGLGNLGNFNFNLLTGRGIPHQQITRTLTSESQLTSYVVLRVLIGCHVCCQSFSAAGAIGTFITL